MISDSSQSKSFSSTNIWGHEKTISQSRLDAASGKDNKSKLLNRVKTFFSKGIWLSDSKIKTFGKVGTTQAVETGKKISSVVNPEDHINFKPEKKSQSIQQKKKCRNHHSKGSRQQEF